MSRYEFPNACCLRRAKRFGREAAFTRIGEHQTFHIDDEAHRRCVELLSVAGLTFHEEDHTTFRITERTPEVHCIVGESSSVRGTFPCQLSSSASGCTFRVTVTEDLAILDEIERAFQGHLLDRR